MPFNTHVQSLAAFTPAGLAISYYDSDPAKKGGPTIVLLHGTSASLHTWEGWAEALRGQRRVIRMDLPGFALTGPNPENDYSIERYVAFVAALADQLGVQRFVLGGNSLGGQIAWATAVAQATLAAFVTLAIIAPAGALAEVPLAARLAGLGTGIAVCLVKRRWLLPALLAGLAVMLLVRALW